MDGPAVTIGPSLARQLVLVEDALVEAGGEADIVDVALLHVDAAPELATRRVGVLPDERLEEVRRLDRDRATAAGHVEVGADVAAQVRQPEPRPRHGRHGPAARRGSRPRSGE